MNARCCWPPESARSRRRAQRAQPDALERLVDRVAVVTTQPAVRVQRRASGLDDVTHGRRRMQADLRPLREVADARPVAEAARAGSPYSSTAPCVGRSSPSAIRSNVVLPPPFGPAIATNSPCSTRRSTFFSTCGPWP